MHQYTRGTMHGSSWQEAFRILAGIVKQSIKQWSFFIHHRCFAVKPYLHLSPFFRLLETYSSYSTPNVNSRRGK